MRDLASARVSAAAYLVHGRLWRPPRWLVSRPTMRLHDYLASDPAQYCPTPLLLAEVWRADDGSFALVAANHGLNELLLSVRVDLGGSGQPEQPVFINGTVGARSVAVHVLPVLGLGRRPARITSRHSVHGRIDTDRRVSLSF